MAREFLVFRPAVISKPIAVDAERLPLGSQDVVRAALARVFGEGTWQAVDQGVFDGPGFGVLAKIGIDPSVDTMTLETWGTADPMQQIIQLCEVGDWQAVDLTSWEVVAR